MLCLLICSLVTCRCLVLLQTGWMRAAHTTKTISQKTVKNSSAELRGAADLGDDFLFITTGVSIHCKYRKYYCNIALLSDDVTSLGLFLKTTFFYILCFYAHTRKIVRLCLKLPFDHCNISKPYISNLLKMLSAHIWAGAKHVYYKRGFMLFLHIPFAFLLTQ